MKALKNNLLFLSYIWKSDKWRIPLAVTISLLQSFVSLLLEIYMIKYILDSFQIGRSFKDVLVVLTIMIGSALLSFLFADWYNNIYVPISNNKFEPTLT